MITTTGRFPEEPLPRLGSEGAEAPEFPVTFSRPADLVGRSEARPNTFRWAGSGTIRVLERGLLVIARRRSPLRFYTTEQRLVPAWEIADVYREGPSVRLDLRGDARQRDFFQFWAADASTAGTIVRLLPTTRTIEFEGAPPSSRQGNGIPPPSPRRTVRVDTLIPIALAVALAGIVALLTIPKLRDYISPAEQAHPRAAAAAPTPTTAPPAAPVSARRATDAEVVNARMTMNNYDERIDGLRAQFRMASTALQYGDLSREDFIDGVNRWLIPQWRSMYSEIASHRRSEEPLDLAVRNRLMAAALGWDGALREYVRGLREGNYLVVLGAADQMSAANGEQQQAWRLIDREGR
jgi:hypothetical protein